MRLVLVLVLVAAAAVLAATASAGGSPPVRTCGERIELTDGARIRFVAAHDVVIGPIAFGGLQEARDRTLFDRRNGVWWLKVGVKVLYGGRNVTVSALDSRLALDYARGVPRAQAVTFEPCPPDTATFTGANTVGRVTAFSGGLGVTRFGCYPLEIRVDRGRSYRGVVRLGVNRCG